ncbi:MAG TPA: PIG-L family deacetylase [Phycisphaerae bacterium]|nr:PIG-L family deacetylase [Phycisphaerae bacterium]
MCVDPQDAERLARCEEQVAAVVVAHPDDETLWAGGMILLHPKWHWTVAALCRQGDPDRAPKFARVMDALGAAGQMGDLDDGPDQHPLDAETVQQAVGALLGGGPFDLVLTHSPAGEYTRHRRHEEVGKAVAALWEAGRLRTAQLWMFAYDDDGGRDLPRPDPGAHLHLSLPEAVFRRKRSIITDIYGFGPDTFEARSAGAGEAFWCFDSPSSARRWIETWEERP